MNRQPPLPTVRIFAPEVWGEVQRFANFYEPTHKFKARDARAVSGVGNHFEKSVTLQTLALKLKPGLEIDKAQLDEKGYTPALNAHELSAVVEAAVLELYSSIDCAAKVIRAIYGPGSRSFPESTRRFFQSVETISGSLPESVKTVVKQTTWYGGLLYMRDELTHLSTGSCSRDHKTGLVNYFHPGMRRNEEPFVIEDIFDWLSNTTAQVNRFLGQIFSILNTTIKPIPVQQVCGFVEGRLLIRYVDPTEIPLIFNSGQCFAYRWFEKPDNPTCPFVSTCGAYQRKMA
jgi:hypothetical protein